MTFERPFFLAPLSGYTSWPMRVLCREQGAELCYTEMISAEGLIRSSRSSASIIERPGTDRPLVAQIFTASPHTAALAARMLEDRGFDGIDINMGCPVKKVVSKGAGSALMLRPELALRLVEAVVRSVGLPVSVKLRAGWDASCVNAPELADAFARAGIDTVILHPRTRAEMYRGTPRWEVLADLRSRVGIPVAASGDIRTRADVARLANLGVDAFVVGRAAIGNPWIFRQLAGGEPPTQEERKDAMLRHLDMLCSYHGSRTGVLHMRKFLSSYVRGLEGAAGFRQAACTLDSPAKISSAIGEFFEALGQRQSFVLPCEGKTG